MMDKDIMELAIHQGSIVNKLLAERSQPKQKNGAAAGRQDWHINETGGPDGAPQYTLVDSEQTIKTEPAQNAVEPATADLAQSNIVETINIDTVQSEKASYSKKAKPKKSKTAIARRSRPAKNVPTVRTLAAIRTARRTADNEFAMATPQDLPGTRSGKVFRKTG